MSWLVNIFGHVLLVAAGAMLCYLLLWWRDRNLKKVRAYEAESELARARAEAENFLHEARSAGNKEALQLREQVEQSLAGRKAELGELDSRLAERERLINSQLQRIVEQEQALQDQRVALVRKNELLQERERELDNQERAARNRLQEIAGLTETQAHDALLQRVEQECLRDANTVARHILEDARTRAEEKARHILSTAIQRYAGEHTFQTTTATIQLAGDEIKGRIIGREGRNIRAFEAATGITVLIDDTPGAVLLSGFDPVRREIAREAMLRLIQDGRIHPTRIEEVVDDVSREMDETIMTLGEQAVQKAGSPPINPEIIKVLGRLHFRHSYSQNILDHSVEVAQLMGLMAAELGLDVVAAKKAGLLHDLGKAINHEVEGPHALVGADYIKRHGESETVVNAVASHHNDIAPVGPLGILVGAADAISASRPGARSENMTTYLKRMEDLEKLAVSCVGVDKAFAVQAGRELRVFVHPDKVDDEQAYALARRMASRIENELQYPGQIRVVIIRETRCVEVAK